MRPIACSQIRNYSNECSYTVGMIDNAATNYTAGKQLVRLYYKSQDNSRCVINIYKYVFKKFR